MMKKFLTYIVLIPIITALCIILCDVNTESKVVVSDYCQTYISISDNIVSYKSLSKEYTSPTTSSGGDASVARNIKVARDKAIIAFSPIIPFGIIDNHPNLAPGRKYYFDKYPTTRYLALGCFRI